MKIGIYFLFYVAMILELLIFIVDRDDAEDRLRGLSETIADSLAASYSTPLRVSVRDSVELRPYASGPTREIISVAGLWTPEERRDLRFHLIAPAEGSWRRGDAGAPGHGREGEEILCAADIGRIAALADERTGSGVLELHLARRPGRVGVWCETRRHIPGYLPEPTRDRIRDRLRAALTGGPGGGRDDLNVSSDTAWFSTRSAIDVKKPRVVTER